MKKGVELLEQVVAVRTTVLTEEHPDRLWSQRELAITYRTDGQVKKAVEPVCPTNKSGLIRQTKPITD